MPSFLEIADFYDDLMKDVPYRMWTGYYLLLLAQQNVKPQRVLDVCCGTGTMCEMLTREGKELTGFDLSETMIRVARQKAHKKRLKIRYEVADVTSLDLGDTFEGAYSFFDSLNYITDAESLSQAIVRVSQHLDLGGSFVFDLNTAYAFEAKMFDQHNKNPRAKVRYDWKGDWDPHARIIRVHMKFWVGDQEYEETHVQRAHSDEEVRAMLDEAGFDEVRCFESYGLDQPRKRSDRVHYSAIKRRDP
ncbi:MAG: methyltransferase domain-containing protein [Fimbriimonadaceae bacterium]|nr:methyltransferase domain-containing protein [Fimbriimonadaceae bacterium]